MSDLSFSGLVVVAAIAFAAPLLLGLAPQLRLPAAVLELVAGIAIGPSGFGWVEVDEPIQVVSLLGLAFLLFLAGLELELRELRGKALRLALGGFGLTVVLALAAGAALDAAGAVESALLVGIALMATSLGLVVPVLKDAGESSTAFGQLVIAAASIAEVGGIVLLSLFFSREASSVASKLVLLGGFALLAIAVAVAATRAGRSMRLGATFVRLQDTTAQIRVRGAFVLLAAFAALAEQLGLEVILGAFTAGAVLALVDRDQAMTHPQFRVKLEAAGYGIFAPSSSSRAASVSTSTRSRPGPRRSRAYRSYSRRCSPSAACPRCSTGASSAPGGRSQPRSCRRRRSRYLSRPRRSGWSSGRSGRRRAPRSCPPACFRCWSSRPWR